MANVLTNIEHKILSRALASLRETVILPRLVNTDYSLDAAKKGDTINVPVPATKAAAAVTPAQVPPAPDDDTPGTVAIALDKWYHADFHLTDKEMLEVEKTEHHLPMETTEAVRALAYQVNADLWAEYTDVYNFEGSEAAIPFASNYDQATAVRKRLNDSLCPLDQRRMVIGSDAEAEVLQLTSFAEWQKSSDPKVIIEGQMGRKLGFDWFMDNQVPTHTHGTLTNGATHTAKVNDATYTVGETTVDIDETTLTGTVKIGDLFTVAGDTQTYVVTANATAVGNAIAGMAFLPASKVAWADDAVVTFAGASGGTTTQHMAFRRDAFALAVRPLQSTVADLALGNRITTMQDPVSKLVLRLEVSRQFKQTVWDLDILYGVKCVRPEFACRLLGT